MVSRICASLPFSQKSALTAKSTFSYSEKVNLVAMALFGLLTVASFCSAMYFPVGSNGFYTMCGIGSVSFIGFVLCSVALCQEQPPPPRRFQINLRDPNRPGKNPHDPPKTGFTNIGNSCYISASLQALFRLDELNKCITPKSYPTLHAKNVKKLREEIFKEKGSGILPGNITDQHDAHEFLMYVLDKIKWAPMTLGTRIHYKHPVTGLSQTYLTDKQPASHISLEVKEKQTFEKLLNSFFDPEEMKDNLDVEDVGTISEFSKKLEVLDWPNLLLVHLKRFDRKGNKISTPVDFPLDGLVNVLGKTYQIVANINHHGSTARNGHYTTDIRDVDADDGSWTHYNDDKVTSNIFPKKSEEEAYLVFLREVKQSTTPPNEPQRSRSNSAVFT